jgi:hypothetical protein
MGIPINRPDPASIKELHVFSWLKQKKMQLTQRLISISVLFDTFLVKLNRAAAST